MLAQVRTLTGLLCVLSMWYKRLFF